MSTKAFFILLALMVLVAGTSALFRKNRADSELPVCTQEVLVCPDGTSVARAGVQCQFAACPNQSTYTGKLIQQDGAFFLVVGSQNQTGDVSYSLPLELKVSTVVGQLVNQQVTAHGSFVVGNTYSVDSLEEVPSETANTTEVGIGETKFVNGVSITLNKIVQDNRCPIDVQCIEAGAVTANVTLKSDTDKETFNMPSDEVPHAFDSYQVSIITIAPSRVAAQAPEPASYKLTFKVQENPKPGVADVIFTGTIRAVDTGCFADGICSVTVDDKKVITTIGFRADKALGKIIGVASIADIEKKIGSKATVFAHKDNDTEYTLYGNSAYYLKVQ